MPGLIQRTWSGFGALRHFAHPANAQKNVAVPFPEVPLLVVKQALATLIATCQPGLTTRFPQLRELLTKPESVGTLGPIRIYAYLVASSKCLSRSSGLSWTIDTASGAGWVWAEFSHWPVGWVMSISRPEPLAGMADVSDWVTSPPGLGRWGEFHLPCQWVIGSQPADFRPPQAFRR